MATLTRLNQWLSATAEHERLEFKRAEHRYDTAKLLKYCAALANEGGGHLVLGVTDQPPRKVVGTHAFASTSSLNELKTRIVQKLGFRVNVSEVQHPDGRVLVFAVPTRPIGQPIALDGAYLMRSGEDLVAMTPDALKRIFAEDSQEWFAHSAWAQADAHEVVALLDTQSYFDLCGSRIQRHGTLSWNAWHPRDLSSKIMVVG